MKLKKRKIFFSWQFEEQERWINEMSENGWQLVKFGDYRYEFNQAAPGEYVYRFQLLNTGIDSDEEGYIRFVEQTSAELVHRRGVHACFRKKTSEGSFELISDAKTRIKLMRRHMVREGISGVIGAYLAISNLYYIINDILFDYKLLLIIIMLIGFIVGTFNILNFTAYLLKYLKLKKQHNLYE